MKFFMSLLVLLLIFPIILNQFTNATYSDSEQIVNAKQRVALANELNVINLNAIKKSPNVLIYFSHPQEAYKPIVLSEVGVTASSHVKANIEAFRPVIEEQFNLNGISVQQLEVDVASQLKSKGLPYKESYNVTRPFVKQQVGSMDYDLVIDFHRDAIKKLASTITHENISFAKVAFVIGTKHKSYEKNYAYAKALHEQMNAIIPKISRGVLTKGEQGANGIYNQDLAENIILIELGAVENTEAEVTRTIAVLARAIANLLTNENM